MLVQSSTPSSVEAAITLASNHGNEDFLYQWDPMKARKTSSHSGKKAATDVLTSICENSGMYLICKRRKIQNNSVIVFPVKTEGDEATDGGVKVADGDIDDACDRGFGSSVGLARSKRVGDGFRIGVECSKSPGVKKKLEVVGLDGGRCENNMRLSRPQVDVGFCNKAKEVDKVSSEPISYVLGMEVSCKICGDAGNTLKMLLCDYCDEAFHIYCCNPGVQILPTSSWFCQSCLKLGCKVSLQHSLGPLVERGNCDVRSSDMRDGCFRSSDGFVRKVGDDILSAGGCNKNFIIDLNPKVVELGKEGRQESNILSPWSDLKVGLCNNLAEATDISENPISHVLGLKVSCKLCGKSGNTLNMLLCDYCNDAFHIACCNLSIDLLPRDGWFCQHCSKLNLKVPIDNSSLKSSGIWSKANYRCEMGRIACMLKYPEPYKSRVRIGTNFQVEVPDWSDQVANNVDSTSEPVEEESVEPFGVQVPFWNKFFNQNSVSNWLQCREVLEGDSDADDEVTICGKWRRAPFSEVQTEDWDCSSAVRWDPRHSDCAVPQELETSEVMKQLNHIEMLRSRLSVKRTRY